ncbi:hc2 nucleoprotein [Chlamydia psittaci M56]|nr:hc2 nucleoprotein [Chlamydia psittaci M56]
MSCHKHHKHTASCQRVCASSAKRRCGSKSRVRTAHGWRQQLMKLVSR